jgi:hypothetical protein
LSIQLLAKLDDAVADGASETAIWDATVDLAEFLLYLFDGTCHVRHLSEWESAHSRANTGFVPGTLRAIGRATGRFLSPTIVGDEI